MLVLPCVVLVLVLLLYSSEWPQGFYLSAADLARLCCHDDDHQHPAPASIEVNGRLGTPKREIFPTT